MNTRNTLQQPLILCTVLMACPLHADMLVDPTRPASSKTPGVAAPVASNKQSWALESTLVAPGRRVAVINGQLVSEGESVEGARVVTIRQLDVLLRKSGRLITLLLLPDIARERP